MEEIWKDVVGFEDYYQISSLGHLMSKERKYVNSLGIYKTLKPKLKKSFIGANGYVFVQLQVNNNTFNTSIHRLVANAFLGKSDAEVNHRDGHKENNNVDNLEFSTRSKNVAHAYRTGLRISDKGINANFAKLNESQVIEIVELAKTMAYKEISAKIGISVRNISSIVRGFTWTHITGIDRSKLAYNNEKLNKDSVLEIIKLKGIASYQEIAKKYGVSVTTISMVMSGKVWSSITGIVSPKKQIQSTRNELNQYKLHCHGLTPSGY